MEMENDHIKKMMKYLAKKNGYKSLADFIEQHGLSQGYVYSQIRRVNKPNVNYLLTYAKWLHLTLDEAVELFFPEEYQDYKEYYDKIEYERENYVWDGDSDD